MKQVKIGILGEIRAGKDTVSQLIIDHLTEGGYKQSAQCFAFSQGIHDVIKQIMPEVYENGKPRKELQDIGQDMRKLKPDVWIDYLFNYVPFQRAISKQQNILITDVRQPNEAKRLQEEGFSIIKVTASEEVRQKRAEAKGDRFNPESFKHEAEIQVHHCPFDYEIDNSYTVENLEIAVEKVMADMLEEDADDKK